MSHILILNPNYVYKLTMEPSPRNLYIPPIKWTLRVTGYSPYC